MSIQNIILAFFITGNAILGLLIYRNNPKSWTNRLFTFLIILLTLYLTLNTELYIFKDKSVRLFFSRLIIALGALINYAVFMFLVTFPKNTISLKKRYLVLITGITAALFLAGFTNLIFADITIDNNVVVPVPGLLMPIFLLHTIGLIFGGIVASIVKLKKSKGLEKIRIRFVLVSFFTLFTLIILLNFILTVFFKYGNFVPFLPIYIFIFNLMITYAIIRHKLLDIKLLVGRAVMFTLLLFVLITFYTVSVFGLVKYLPLWIDRNYVFITMALVVAFSFNGIRQILEKITRKIFFRGHYDTEELLNELIHIMASEINVDNLSNNLLQILTKKMIITKGSFLFIEDNQITDVIPTNFGSKKVLQEKEGLVKLTKEDRELYVFEEMPDSKVKKLFRELNISAVLPLKIKNKAIGLLILGPKASGDIYSDQDLELLSIFAPQAAIALQNAESYRKIKSFSRTLEKKVQERTKELKEAQARELSKAKQLLKIKDEFVFIATHDLGTPVTAIRGFTYLLEKDKNKLSKESRENIDLLQEAGDRLNDLTNDLLQVARSDSGAIEVKTESIDIVALINETLDQASIQAKKQKVSLHDKFHAKKCMVMADEKKLSEVMENLLSNAIKYNKKKGQVTVTTKKVDNNLQVDVADNGIGIPKERHSEVFQKFSRIHRDETEQITGTGLGLFVVRMMIEKMKGKISFISEQGKGTTFSFVLPLPNIRSLKKNSN